MCGTASSGAARRAWTPRQVLDAWFAFGEDAEVPEAGEEAGSSATELHDFAARRASRADRDWRSLDPRAAAEEE